MNRSDIGRLGEDIAATHLEKEGYEILTRNFRIKNAEIDIIAKTDECIVFVEVKLRNGLKYGLPKEAVTAKKQKSISTAALTYLQKIDKLDSKVRFDVIEILRIGTEYRINHIVQAFDFIM